MRIFVAGVALAVAAATFPEGAPAREASPPAGCGQGSWVAGTVELCAGELVYHDYVYDDFGAQSLSRSPTADHGFDFRSMPTFGAWGGLPPSGGQGSSDEADLVALRLRVSGGQVHVSAELNTMLTAKAAMLALAVDHDPGAGTGGGVWPGLVANPGQGTPLAAQGWDDLHVVRQGDADTNLLEARFPQPTGEHWRLYAVVARPDGTVRNVAFRGPDEAGPWWEDLQADALHAGDITGFGLDVAVGDLTGGLSRPAKVAPGRIRQRVYVSQYPLGEGVSKTGVPGPGTTGGLAAPFTQKFTMLGRYQPYGFYQPAQPGPHGFQLVLHGLSENHSARLFRPEGAPAAFASRMGEERNRILAAPLGRGWRGWYSGASERDVLDVATDVEAHYPVDPDRVFISGYSMGGYGAMRIAALHPDRFAGVLNWVGFTGDYANGTPLAEGGSGSSVGADVNVIRLLGSLRHVPMAALYAGADELVLVAGALALRQRLADLGVPSIVYLHPAAGHTTLAAADDWRKESAWSASLTRVRDPARITFRTDRRLFHPELGILPDRAYWLRSITPAGPGFADVDATSEGCGRGEGAAVAASNAGPDPVPWVSSAVEVAGTEPGPGANRLHLQLANVASLAVEMGPACLGAGELAYEVKTDRRAVVSLSDGRLLSLPKAGDWKGTLAPR